MLINYNCISSRLQEFVNDAMSIFMLTRKAATQMSGNDSGANAGLVPTNDISNRKKQTSDVSNRNSNFIESIKVLASKVNYRYGTLFVQKCFKLNKTYKYLIQYNKHRLKCTSFPPLSVLVNAVEKINQESTEFYDIIRMIHNDDKIAAILSNYTSILLKFKN